MHSQQPTAASASDACKSANQLRGWENCELKCCSFSIGSRSIHSFSYYDDYSRFFMSHGFSLKIHFFRFCSNDSNTQRFEVWFVDFRPINVSCLFVSIAKSQSIKFIKWFLPILFIAIYSHRHPSSPPPFFCLLLLRERFFSSYSDGRAHSSCVVCRHETYKSVNELHMTLSSSSSSSSMWEIKYANEQTTHTRADVIAFWFICVVRHRYTASTLDFCCDFCVSVCGQCCCMTLVQWNWNWHESMKSMSIWIDDIGRQTSPLFHFFSLEDFHHFDFRHLTNSLLSLLLL